MVNSENRVLLSIVVPLYNQLLDHVEAKLASMASQDDMFDAIKACHDKLEKYYDISSEICTAATILDPRFKTSAYEDDRDPSSIDVKIVTDPVEQEFIRNYYVQSTVGVNDFLAPNNSQFFKIKRRKYSEIAS